MKKIKQLFYIVVCGTVVFGCHDILDVEPYSVLTEETFFQDAADVETAANGVYDVLSDKSSGLYNQELVNLNVISSDECYSTRQNERAIGQFKLPADNKFVQMPWKGGYKLINRANHFIDAVSKMDSTQIGPNVKRRYLGEVRFLRALSYFNLVRNFNEIPLRKSATNSVADAHVPLSSPEAVYEFILEDLDSAIIGLPAHFSGNNLGRADQAAAKALKAKVYLTMAGFPLKGGEDGPEDEYANALALAQDLIDNKGTYKLGLWPYYGDAFTLETDNGQEDIFCVQFSSSVGLSPQFEGNKIHKSAFKGKKFNGVNYIGLHMYRPSTYLMKAYGKGDERGKLISHEFTIGGKKQAHKSQFKMFTKWIDQGILDNGTNAQVSDQNFKVFRFSEIYLIAAEAENELNGPENAYVYINEVRTRARNGSDGALVMDVDTDGDGVKDASSAVPDLAGLSQEEFRAAVLHERLLEFHCEGKRWHDLVRTETVTEQIQAAQNTKASEFPVLPTEVFLPVPYDEYSRNDSIQ